MIDTATLSRLIQQYPILHDLSDAQLDYLKSNVMSMTVPAGTVMFDEGQLSQGFPMLFSGSVRVIKAAANGRELFLYSVGPGESCVLTSSNLMADAHFHARAIVDRDVEMAVLPPAVFMNLVATHEPFRKHIFEQFSERLIDLMQLVNSVAFQKLDQRLATLLSAKPSPIITTHQALADELGSVRELVSRVLKNFAEQGWIKLRREQIEIIDLASLKKYSQH